MTYPALDHPLDSALTKFNWANKHAHSHPNLSQPFQPEGIDVAIDLDPEGSEYIHRLEFELELPTLSMIVGDVFHNFRSSLDHLLRGLTLMHGGKPGGRDEFPIHYQDPSTVTDPCNPAEAIFRKILEPLNDAERTVLQGIQPYKTGDPDAHPLMRLKRLDNTDKHRALHVISVVPADLQFSARPIRDCRLTDIQPVTGGPYEVGTELGRIGYAPEGASPQIHVETRMTPQILLAETGELVVAVIVMIRQFMVQKVFQPLIPNLFKIDGALHAEKPPWVPVGVPSDPI
jgi:hypothetical protein